MTAATAERGHPPSRSILIVDDHPMLRRGLAALIETDPDLSVCGEAETCQDAMLALRDMRPDLVIIDLALRESDGLDLVKQVKASYPETPTMVLSMHDEAVYAERALRAGARGYVSKQQLDETVLDAIRRVLGGETYMSEQLKSRLAAKFIGGKTLQTDSPLDALTDRELQVFRLIGSGRSTRQIAERLSLSVKTIESHCEHIKQKLTLHSSTELAHRATLWVETGQLAR